MSSADSPSSSQSDDRQFKRWRKELSWFTGLGLTPEEQARRGKERDEKIEASLLKRCERTKERLMRTSPAITFMLKHLKVAGCPVSAEHVECITCQKPGSGNFAPDIGRVILCSRGWGTKRHLEDTIVHELLHIYDHCRFKVDWTNLRHVACSEIRAATLSGDCRWGREINRLNFAFSKQHQACARRRAIISVSGNPACPDEATAERAVNEVWESCFRDTRPFDEIY